MVKRLHCYALCFVLCLAVGQAIADSSSRIWGGEDAGSGAHPWVVSVRVNNVHKGMGSVISPNYVVTAAHFLSQLQATPIDAGRVTLRAGSTNMYAGGVIVNIERIEIHPSYGNFLHDIAVLKIAEPLTFTEKINSIELPEISETGNELENGATVSVQGWGELLTGGSSYKLQTGDYTVLSPQDCEYQAGYGYDSVLCLTHPENTGGCRGDDGAGIVTEDDVLVGILSFQFGNCGTKYPDVASKVLYYREWIRTITSV